MLTSFPPKLSAKAERSLEQLGVTVMTSTHGDGHRRRRRDGRRTSGSPTRTVVWAAGVTASGLAGRLAELSGAEVDRVGRITVEPDLTLPGHPEVFAIGDMVRVRQPDGATTFPGVAPVAMQQGRYAARVVRERLEGRQTAARSPTATRATSPRSAAAPRSPTSRASSSAAWSPG